MIECPIIWLESIIGSGKTTLLKYLSNELNVRPFDEPFEENPYFKDSYEHPEIYAALAQLWFALKRAEIHELATAESLFGTKYDAIVIDRGLPGDQVFEMLHYKYGNIKEREHQLYELFYKNIFSRPKTCSMLVYLDTYPEVALERINNRGREAEKNISLKYLRDLRNEHYDLMVRIANGMHSYSNKIIVKKIPWNVEHQNPEIIVESILKEYPHIRRKKDAT